MHLVIYLSFNFFIYKLMTKLKIANISNKYNFYRNNDKKNLNNKI